MAKRPVQFLDDLSSDEDDYYESQRKKALLGNVIDAPDENRLNGSTEVQNTDQANGPNIEEVVQDSPDTSFGEEKETEPVVTEPEDESEEEPDEESSSTPKVVVRASCAFGDSCYRRNPQHKADFSHPGDSDYVVPAGPSQGGAKPRCEYGSSCYRKNPQHKLDFDHSMPPSPSSPDKPKKRLRDKKQAKKNDDGDEYESDFIDDDEEEEEEDYEESDEEWEPDNEED